MTVNAERLGDPAFFAGSPDTDLARMRAEDPVSWQPHEGLWAVTGHRDIVEISRAPETFCSSRGVLMGDRGRPLSGDDSLLYLDPPRHAQYRKLVNRAFTPLRVAKLEPWLRQLTVRLLDGIDPREPVNLVDALTAPLPLAVIAELLGLPEDDRVAFRTWSDAIMEAATNLTEENALLSLELIAYLEHQIGVHRSAPRDDLLGVLIDAEVDGDRLSDRELVGFCMTLLVAGNETTRSMLSGGLVALAEHPDQRSLLAADPALIPGAVEEMLRWVSPIMAMGRTATCPAKAGDSDVAPGEFTLLVYGAANRDPGVFGESANRFDALRSPNPHLAFGIGEHFCLGAGLARLEGQVLLSEILARWPHYEVSGEVTTVPSTLLRQYSSVPVIFEP